MVIIETIKSRKSDTILWMLLRMMQNGLDDRRWSFFSGTFFRVCVFFYFLQHNIAANQFSIPLKSVFWNRPNRQLSLIIKQLLTVTVRVFVCVRFFLFFAYIATDRLYSLLLRRI